MRQLSNVERVLWCFFEHPGEEFTVRELERLSNVPRSTVQRILRELRKTGLVSGENTAAETKLFRRMKTHRFIERVYEAGLVDELERRFAPSCIILFGSVRKGESNASSDLDLFIETTKEGDEDLEAFEKRLRHPVQLFLHKNVNDLPEHLKNNVINGIKLEGSFTCENRSRGTNADSSSGKRILTENAPARSSQPRGSGSSGRNGSRSSRTKSRSRLKTVMKS